MLEFLNNPYVATVIKSIVVIFALLTAFAYMTLIERRVVAKIQGRLGPNRAGPFGLFQPLADAIKMAFKEQIVPTQAKKFIYLIAPIISVVIALSAFAVVPIGNNWGLGPGKSSVWNPVIADINVGLLWILAVSSLAVYGIVLGGWASGNRYSLLGALRSAAQMVSYETSLGLALSGTLMWAGTLSMVGIVHAQLDQHIWFIFAQPLGFVIYIIAGVAEVNRAPFDLPEAESELIAGFHTEYSSMKFAMFFTGEYVSMMTVSGLNAAMFWGGPLPLLNIPPFTWIPGILWFIIKVMMGIYFYTWLRATLPRLRYDALMGLGWKRMLPIGLVWLFVIALVGAATTPAPPTPTAPAIPAGAARRRAALPTAPAPVPSRPLRAASAANTPAAGP